MAMRFGEMVLIIRTQDFASRNLDRISASLGNLSKAEALNRRRAQLAIQQQRKLSRMGNMRDDMRNIELLRRRLDLEKQLGRAIHTTAGLQARGAGGRFLSIGATSAMVVEMKNLNDAAANMPSRLKRLASSKADLDERARRLAQALGLTSKELRIIQNDIVKLDGAIGSLRWEKLHRMGQTISRLGRTLQLTGLIATGVLLGAGNAAANFGADVSVAATQMRDLNAPISQVASRATVLEDAILGQMQKFPGSAEEMSNAAYEIFSSLDLMDKGRVKVHRGLKLLEKANMVAVAGNIGLDESIKGLVITLNNFDPQLENVGGTLDTMFDVVRFGNIRVSDFTQMMNRLAPAAKNANLSLEQISGTTAFLTRVMASGRVSTGLARLLEAFRRRDFVVGFRELSKMRLGKVLDVEKASGGLKAPLKILKDIARVFPELEAGKMSAEEFFKIVTQAGKLERTGKPGEGIGMTIFAREALTQSIQNLDQIEELQIAIMQNKGEFSKAFEAMANTPAVQWKVFINQLKAFALEVGRAVLPAMITLAGKVEGLIKWFGNLSPNTKKSIAAFALFVSVGVLLLGVLGSLAGAFLALVGTLGILSASMGGGKGGVIGRLATMLMLMRRLVGIGAIVLTIKLIVDSEEVKKIDKWLKENIPGGDKIFGALEFSGTDLLNKIRGKDKNKGLVFNPDAEINFDKNLKMMEQTATTLRKARAKKNGLSFPENINQMMKNIKNETVLKELGEIRDMFGDTGEASTEMAEAVEQAMDQAQQSIDQGVGNMTNTFKQFRDQNKQAFGSLFGGPFFQSETWSLAEEWGVKPGIQQINQDLQGQIDQFRKWRGTLDSIGSRGAPTELVQELQELGPDALDKLEAIRKAAPGQFNKFISLWKTKQTEIEKATKIDFDKQLQQWFKFGKGIAQQIILGLRSEDVQLDNAFRQYITSKFPGIIEQAKQQAIKEFKRQQQAANPTLPTSSQKPTGSSTTIDDHSMTITITPKKGESSADAARRAAHALKNKYKGKT